jgi:hypothetical protein
MSNEARPGSFRSIRLDEAERTALLRFLDEAERLAPDVAVVAPRRSSSGALRVVVEFPDGVDSWQTTGDLVELAQRIEVETGVYLHLD